MVIHIPHSSFVIPEKYREGFLISDIELKTELLRMTDSYTDLLFDSEFETLIFPISRLVCDVERFRNDADEIMATRGMGAIYTRTSEGRLFRNIPDTVKSKILNEYYDVHHMRFENIVRKILDKDGLCIIIDGHSFPGKPLLYEMDQLDERPDFCIGADQYHTPNELIEIIKNYLEYNGYKVEKNRPYAGAIVPSCFYRKNKSVMSIMLEINRRLYMDELTGNKGHGFCRIRKIIKEALSLINGFECSLLKR